MANNRPIPVLLLGLLLITIFLAACGRQLPESTPIPPPPPTEAPPTEEADAETDDSEAETTTEDDADSDATSEEATDEEAVVAETVEEAEDVDPFVAQVNAANPANGALIFQQTYTTASGDWACSLCHNAANAQRLVGPGLLGLPQNAATRVEGQSAHEYVYNSIIHPNDYIVEEPDFAYPPGLMPQNYEEVLSEAELLDLIAYLMTLDDPELVAEVAEADSEASEATTDEAAVAEADTEETQEAIAQAEAEAETEAEEDTTEDVTAEMQETAEAEETVTEESVEETAVAEADTEDTVTEPEEAQEEDAPSAPVSTSVTGIEGTGVAEFGEYLFSRAAASTEVGEVSCADCHALQPGEELDGPSLANVSALAGDTPVADYLYQAITDPNVHPGLQDGYAETLDDALILDLIAYLISQDSAVEAAPAEEAAEAAPTEDIAEAEAEETTESAAEVEAPAEETNTEEDVAQTEAETAAEEDPIVAAIAAADAANGETLYNQLISDVGFACSTCHNANNEQRLIGPGLLNIQDRAGTRVEGEAAEVYLYNAIIHPNDYIVQEPDYVYPENLMPQVYADIFSEEEIYDIIAYLLTLGD